MISKFKNKKTCKRLGFINRQKGGSSSPPKQKITSKVKKSLKKFKKMVKVASMESMNPDFATQFKTKKFKKEIKTLNQNYPKTFHLLPKNYSDISKAAKRLNKYKNNQSYTILKQYINDLESKSLNKFNTSTNLHNSLKTTLAKNIKSEKEKTLLISEIKKILHP
jgi:hypothetical protein